MFNEIVKKFSSLNKIINVTAYVRRVFQGKSEKQSSVVLSVKERVESFNKLIQVDQSSFFKNEINALKNGEPISKNSRLIALNCFIDNNSLVRVGGRLSNTFYSYDRKYPIIISCKSRLLYLYALFLHLGYFHASNSLLQSQIGAKFWIVGGAKGVVKKMIRGCLECTKWKAETYQQRMGDLPAARAEASRPFSNAGVDLTGEIEMKCTRHRTMVYYKYYIIFFVCFATKAVHIEWASDLTTSEMFMAAFERFVARRGLPVKMMSDNGSNLKGAKSLISSTELKVAMTNKGVEWECITPRSPHKGGLWEAAVKGGKLCLQKVTRGQTFTLEEMVTVIAEIEAILNSRPMCKHPTEDSALTLAHFLIGESLHDVPILNTDTKLLKQRYLLIRDVVNSYWKEWRNCYLRQLQVRNKWRSSAENVQVGEVVLIMDDDTPPMTWPMGIVSQVFPSKTDGLVRLVEVKTIKGLYQRVVQKLMLMMKIKKKKM